MTSAAVFSAMLSIVARSMVCRSLSSSGRFERAREADAITRSNMRMRAANLATAGVSIPSRWSRRKSAQSCRCDCASRTSPALHAPGPRRRYRSWCVPSTAGGAINQRAGTGAADSVPAAQSGPRSVVRADPSPQAPRSRARSPAWPRSALLYRGVADGLLRDPARDRGGDGDELIGRCGHRHSYGLRDTAAASGVSLDPGGIAKHGLKHPPHLRSRPTWLSAGRPRRPP